jgi:hypothetical protein
MVESLERFIDKRRPDFLSLPKLVVNYGYSSGDGGVISGRLIPFNIAFGVPVRTRKSVDRVKQVGVDSKDFSDDFLARWRLRAAIMDSNACQKYFMSGIRDEPVFANWLQAGRLPPTVPSGVFACGSYRRTRVCNETALHAGKFLNGVDVTGKAVLRLEHYNCNIIGCSVCFLDHAVLVAVKATARLETAMERFKLGEPNHATVSPDRWLVSRFMEKYGRNWEEKLWAYELRFLQKWGVLGGGRVRHIRRYDKWLHDLYASPHSHIVSFLGASWDECVKCNVTRSLRTGIAPECHSCSKGFMAKVVADNAAGSGLVLKVHEARKSVKSTFAYLMSHASQNLDVKRDHVLVYFGLCGNRKFKTKPLDKTVRCVVCKSEMRSDLHYCGSVEIVKDVGRPSYKPVVLVDSVDSVTGFSNFFDENLVDEGGGQNG